MSGRYRDYDKGSSRSTRDDSRPYKERREDRERPERRRSRSRSPRRWSPTRSSSYGPGRSSSSRERDRRDYEDRSHKHAPEWDEPEDVPAPPPPPRITKISIGFNKPKTPIKMNIGGPAKPVAKPAVASVFSADDDDEPEEMPAEARMRMRNIGRETPTSAGPNSFGKTKQGFCDAKKVFEKNLKQALEMADKPAMPKLPQTIYKIKGP
ncbi:PEST proteolytic signal-containing nuclear protein-like [Helicoverpa zea]|uniref:PEST proteolytic signal-containing nuclear protein-like n=1 Tax=Helicoverpa zea TaxID=7113 RepID=UPI001F598CA8|nr:PEST proteolytic signal-containing nuclear protein-like [Helicoverpa zea]